MPIWKRKNSAKSLWNWREQKVSIEIGPKKDFNRIQSSYNIDFIDIYDII